MRDHQRKKGKYILARCKGLEEIIREKFLENR